MSEFKERTFGIQNHSVQDLRNLINDSTIHESSIDMLCNDDAVSATIIADLLNYVEALESKLSAKS